MLRLQGYKWLQRRGLPFPSPRKAVHLQYLHPPNVPHESTLNNALSQIMDIIPNERIGRTRITRMVTLVTNPIDVSGEFHLPYRTISAQPRLSVSSTLSVFFMSKARHGGRVRSALGPAPLGDL